MPPEITVELNVFSGRPNPTWILDAKDAALLNQKLAGLQSESSLQLPPQGLGYQGFTVRKEGEGKNEVFVIYSGAVQTSDGKILKDEHQAEELLLQQARENGYKDLLDDLGINK